MTLVNKIRTLCRLSLQATGHADLNEEWAEPTFGQGTLYRGSGFRTLLVVIAGLDPAIHLSEIKRLFKMDARVKARA